RVGLQNGSVLVVDAWTIPHALDRATHWLILAAAAALTALWWRRRAASNRPLLLLTLLLLVRVVFDPRAHVYHSTPFVLALVAAEAVAFRGFQWRSVAASVLLAVVLRLFDTGAWTAANVVYLAAALPALLALGVIAFR